MKASFFLTLAAAIYATAAPTPEPEQAYDIILKPSANVKQVLAAIERKTDDEVVKHTFDNSYFRGFSGTFSKVEVEKLRKIPGVDDVEPQVQAKLFDTRAQAPWGLQRVSQADTVKGNPNEVAFTYTFNDPKLGEGVDIYVIDTGIRTTHEQFGGRAKMGFSSTGVNTDDNGHGTHVSGTAAGQTVGVASKANLIGVKVLNGDGAGTSGDFIKGLDFVVQEHEKRSKEQGFKGSVASMSLGFTDRQRAVDRAVSALSNAGVHMSIASGNEGTDGCDSTPGALGGKNSDIVAVGAHDINDKVAEFSNTGTCTDIFGPGVAVISSFPDSDTAYASLDGTSMACPHITGLMAFMLGSNGADMPTGELKSKIVGGAVSNLLKPSDTLVDGSDLIIAGNGGAGNGTAAARFFRRDPYTGRQLYRSQA